MGAEEVCPVLFRDVGPAATGRFLRGELSRLAGPLSPIIYTRTARWREPYVDHGQIGRLLFLRPLALGVWHSGVDDIFVAAANRTVDPATLVYVPGDVGLSEAAALAGEMVDHRQWREALGGAVFDDRVSDAVERIERLDAELERVEEVGEPLRRRLQRGGRSGAVARELLERIGVGEHDLCAAWHHIEGERRSFVLEALEEVRGEVLGLGEEGGR